MHMSNTFAIAGLCFVAYLLGVRRRQAEAMAASMTIVAVKRAQEAAATLQQVVDALHRSIREHQVHVRSFQQQLTAGISVDVHEVEQVVGTSRQLVLDLESSHSRICEQLSQLRALTESRMDSLTGVANRRSFEEELSGRLARYKQLGETFALACVDIDHFKLVNDSFGHPVGDKVLQQVARVLVEHVRNTDCVARIGGEEFGIIMPNFDLAVAGQVLERIRTALAAASLVVEQRQVRVTISAGVVVPAPGESAHSLIGRADAMLYRAKENGRNQTCHDETLLVASPAPGVRRTRRQERMASLRAPEILDSVGAVEAT